MTGIRIASRDARALKVLAAVLACAATWFGWGALAASRPSESAIELLEQRYLLAREQAARIPALQRDATETRRSLAAMEKRLLASESPPMAQAALRSLLVSLLEGEGIGLSRSAFQAAVPYLGRYVAIPLEVEFACQVEQLPGLMVALVAADPIIATRRLQIDALRDGRDLINVSLVVESYLRTQSAASRQEESAS